MNLIEIKYFNYRNCGLNDRDSRRTRQSYTHTRDHSNTSSTMWHLYSAMLKHFYAWLCSQGVLDGCGKASSESIHHQRCSHVNYDLMQAINSVHTEKTRYKLWQGAWLKEAASVTHSESGVWLSTASATSARPTLHIGSAAGFVRFWA
jgi:hypothetical protein